MTALILPEMRGTYDDAMLRSTSRELIDGCNLAHSRAVSFNQPHRVRIESRSGKFLVEKRVRDRGQELFVALRDIPGCEGKLDTRITVDVRTPGEENSEGQTSTATPSDSSMPPIEKVIMFYPDGTADAREVVLEDRQGFRLALRINPTTARLKIIDLERR